MELISCGASMPSLTNIGRMSSSGRTRVSATSRRIAAVVRNRRGRASGKRAVIRVLSCPESDHEVLTATPPALLAGPQHGLARFDRRLPLGGTELCERFGQR